MGEGICPEFSLGGRRGCGTSYRGSCWVRALAGTGKVCYLHGVVSDGLLLAGVEPGAASVGLAVRS